MERNNSAIHGTNSAEQKRLNRFLVNLRQCRSILSRNTLLTLRGQALSGDIEGAERGLARLRMCAEHH